MPSPKNSLDIRLTESVVFLRTGDGTGRTRSGTQPATPPALVRGLLILNIVKPTKISSIEVELSGKTSTAWPEGVGARRIEVNEDHKIHSQSFVLFKAGASSSIAQHRRTLSVGPGLFVEHDQDDSQSDGSSERAAESPYEERRGRDPNRGQRGRAPRRLSADQTNFQPGFISHHNEQLPTPPYSPMYSPNATPLRRSPAPSFASPISLEDSSAHSIEEFGMALSERTSAVEPQARSASTSGHDLTSPISEMPPLSRRISFEDPPPEFVLGSSSSHIQAPASVPVFYPGPARSAVARQASSPPPQHQPFDERGRKGRRTAISMLLDAVKERVRSVSRVEHDTPPQSRSRDARDGSAEACDPSSRRARTRERSTLERVTEVLGLESDDEDDAGEGWKEFRKGIYTYPVSFAIPPGSPPTLCCEFGAVVWRLKAFAHRPGTFTTKLSATKEVTVVACPSEDDTEESESIIVERQWDSQMQYMIAISGRSFPIGGTIPFNITFMPWTKMKVFRLSVVIEERVDYFTDFKRLVRADPLTRVVLLSIKDPQKERPILPLSPEDIQMYRGTALFGSSENDEDLSEIISSMLGPGPWTIQRELQLPKSCDELHFTNKNKKSNITISHTLKVIFRVQRGDDHEVDPHTGKRKLFDVVVQTPIHILSCLCGSDYTALPPYSEHSAASMLPSATRCRCGVARVAGLSNDDAIVPIIPTPDSVSETTSPHGSIRVTSPPLTATLGSHASLSRTAPSNSRPPLLRLESILDRNSLYERLVAGRESESGEAPPAYEQIAAR